MTEPILLTVLMTVHNGEPYLRESVASILNQTYRNFNFFILDNASSDDSANIIKSFNDKRIKLIELSSNIGQTRALNMGLKIIKAKYTAGMDADDIALPTRFEKQINYLINIPNVCVVGTNHFIIDKKNRHILNKNSKKILNLKYFFNVNLYKGLLILVVSIIIPNSMINK